jgi:hypothetical protein
MNHLLPFQFFLLPQMSDIFKGDLKKLRRLSSYSVTIFKLTFLEMFKLWCRDYGAQRNAAVKEYGIAILDKGSLISLHHPYLSRAMVVYQPNHIVLDPVMMTWMGDSTF